MRKYFDENEKEVIKAREIAEKQFIEQNEDIIDYDNAISFEHFGISIVNPFLDDTGIFEFTLDDAYEFYGSSCMNWFIEACNEEK